MISCWLCLGLKLKVFNDFPKLIDVLKASVDRGEANIGHLIESCEFSHDVFADQLGRNFALPVG